MGHLFFSITQGQIQHLCIFPGLFVLTFLFLLHYKALLELIFLWWTCPGSYWLSHLRETGERGTARNRSCSFERPVFPPSALELRLTPCSHSSYILLCSPRCFSWLHCCVFQGELPSLPALCPSLALCVCLSAQEPRQDSDKNLLPHSGF